jgi:hypothetical protein
LFMLQVLSSKHVTKEGEYFRKTSRYHIILETRKLNLAYRQVKISRE